MYLKKKVIEIEVPQIIFRPEDIGYLNQLISIIDNPHDTLVNIINSLQIKHIYSVNICDAFKEILENIEGIKDITGDTFMTFVETLKHYLEEAIKLEDNINVYRK